MWFLYSVALACDPSDLVRELKAGEAAFAQNDSKAVSATAKRASKAVSCTRPTPEQNARLHRLHAFDAGFKKDWPTAQEAWRASLASHPLMKAPPTLMAHPRLHLAWVRAMEQGVTYSISSTRQPIAGLNTPLVADLKASGSSSRSRKRNLRVAALGVGVVAGALYGGAWASNRSYNKLEIESQNFDKRKSQFTITNGLSIASVGAAALGSTLFVVSFAK